MQNLNPQTSPQRKKLQLFSLGGTICMQASANSGLECALNAEQLAASAHLEAYELHAKNLAALPSPSLDFAHIISIYNEAAKAHAAGISAFVITQGTDTLAESAFLLSLLWDLPAAAVFTGAMRSPDALGAEGAANLHAAAAAAACARAGVYLCANDVLIAPAFAQKAHSAAVQAFWPLQDAGCARFFEGRWRYLERAECSQFAVRCAACARANLAAKAPKIGVYSCALGDDDGYFRAILSGALALDALVIDGFGAGHVHEAHAAIVGQIAAKMPVVIASRCFDGGSAKACYAYAGSEIDLAARGCILAGVLGAQKARLALAVLLAGGASKQEIAGYFASCF